MDDSLKEKVGITDDGAIPAGPARRVKLKKGGFRLRPQPVEEDALDPLNSCEA
jgi:hypothetical protein